MARPTVFALAVVGLTLSSACGREDAAATDSESEQAPAASIIADEPASEKAVPEAAAPKPDLAEARALIGRIYSQYASPPKDVDIPFTPELDAAIEKLSGDDPTGLGYDIFCECQDPGDPGMLKHMIKSLEPTADGAIARVSLAIGEPPSTDLTIRLARRGSKWMVADVSGAEGSLLEKGK